MATAAPARPLRFALAPPALALAAVLAFLLIGRLGAGVVAGAPAPEAAAKSGGLAAPLPQILLALAAIVVVARAVGAAFSRLGQPPVIGEVFAGILLGPSFFGTLAPGAAGRLFPPEVTGHLNILAQVGVILYLFVVGLELDTGMAAGQGLESVTIAAAGMAAPFVLGAALALGLFPRFGTQEVSFTAFALFVGVAMSVTAFPVLARILTDRGLVGTPLGGRALACAAAGDAAAWCLLALAAGVAQSHVGAAAGTLLGTAAFFAVMVLAVRPLLLRWLGRRGGLNQDTVAVLLVGVLASAWVTEMIGIHALFGAFLFGAIIPHKSPAARQMGGRLRDVVTVLLLPAYFAFTGLRTRIGLVDGTEQWLLCGGIVVVATLGKFGGTYFAARLTGVAQRDSAALGVLMNTRGLMEMVVLNVGLDLGVISPSLFAMMVVMALATTVATGPALRLLGVGGASAASTSRA
jgi:Kef-type K+ transport system membrane component KefB